MNKVRLKDVTTMDGTLFEGKNSFRLIRLGIPRALNRAWHIVGMERTFAH